MKAKAGDIILGLFLIGAIVLLIVPIEGNILDIFFSINLALSLVVLFNALFAKEALSMAAFPSLLLFTTIFRLSLNVASTKLILGRGEAGNVVQTFGGFVAGNNQVVGIIVFIVIVIIQFLVITKGSERVAEVSARFTLDAMPGKQMAIDADLNAGIIDETQARERRQKIQDEASFYGAMDGASKFVKGDAIAGIIITFINIIAGLVIGVVMLKKPLQEAVVIYTTLTIGDGLISQIPALLISLATGILVTKVSNDSDLSTELKEQLFSLSKVFYLAGAVLVFLGAITPLKFLVVGTTGICLIVAGYYVDKQQQLGLIQEEITEEDTEAEEIRKPENVVSLLQVQPIELEFGYGIIPLADVNQGGDLLDRVVMIRRQIALELGTVVPIIRLRDNIQLNPNEYIIKIKGVEVSRGEIMFDHYMAMNPGYVEEEIDGIETVEPAFNLPALWITESQRENAEAVGFTVVDPPSIMATHLTEVIKRHLDELLNRQDVQTLIDNVKENNPTLIDELVPKIMSVGEIQKVLMNLLKERVSIRDLVTIFETLADFAVSNRDTEILTEYVRQSLKRQISRDFLDRGMNDVITLDPKLEQMIMDSVQHTEQGSYLAIDPSNIRNILDSTNQQIEKVAQQGKAPIVLTSPIVRTYYKKLSENLMPDLTVLSFNEVEQNYEVQAIGMVSLS